MNLLTTIVGVGFICVIVLLVTIAADLHHIADKLDQLNGGE